jgi:hypothetical protein
LQVIHDLNVTDKHRLLVVVTHTLALGNTITVTKWNCADPDAGIELPGIIDGRTRYPWTIDDGVEVHWIPYRASIEPEIEMKMNSTIQIAFEKVGTLKREPVIPILRQLCQGVETAIHTFDGLF